ncbi:MAG TPA: YoaK family protein [Stellaceae bacterium]|nr:YoaK family protein [Stellaceae bacterium]
MFGVVLLAAVAGCADALGYLHFRTFAGLMTGNTVFLGLALFGHAPAGPVLYIAVIAAFCAGVTMSRVALRLGMTPRPVLILTVLILLGLNFSSSRWAPAMLAFGMGAQNAATTRVAGVTVNTVFLTGDLQQLMGDLVARLFPGAKRERPAPRELIALALVWTSYVGGAVLGAALNLRLAQPFLVPAGLLLLFLLYENISKAADF